MRQLYNAFAEWIGRGIDDGDAWSALGRVAVIAALFAALVAVGVGIIVIAASVASSHSAPEHGSCKVGHYTYSAATKTHVFVCDEYYPLPQVVEGQ